MDQVNQTQENPKPALPLRFVSGLFKLVTRLFLVLLFILIGLFIGGFLKFSTTVVELESNSVIPQSDGIAVLTGGSKRISQALQLVKDGRATRLLISGVNPNTPLEDLRKAHPEFAAQFDCCVDVESIAADTVGNARETAKWVESKGYKSLILVTSGYHMPRSLLEFRRLLPQTKLVTYPVPLDALQNKNWWHEPKNVRLLLSEYVKYLGASARQFSPSFVML